MKKTRLLSPGVFILAVALTYASALSQEAPVKSSGKVTTGVATPGADASAKSKPPAVRRAAKIDPVDGKLLSPYSLAERTAMNRLDCKPNALRKDGVGMHGVYRGYGQWDPELKSIEGRKQFEACVKRGLEPTPWFAFGQRGAIAMGTKFFGRGKEECLMCHSKY